MTDHQLDVILAMIVKMARSSNSIDELVADVIAMMKNPEMVSATSDKSDTDN